MAACGSLYPYFCRGLAAYNFLLFLSCRVLTACGFPHASSCPCIFGVPVHHTDTDCKQEIADHNHRPAADSPDNTNYSHRPAADILLCSRRFALYRYHHRILGCLHWNNNLYQYNTFSFSNMYSCSHTFSAVNDVRITFPIPQSP